MKQPCVYLLASKRNGTFYTGMTANIIQRVALHKNGDIKGFTQDYGVSMLVWLEWHATMPDAIKREKQLKKWERGWKLRLIETVNPDWFDLYIEMLKPDPFIDVFGSPFYARHSRAGGNPAVGQDKGRWVEGTAGHETFVLPETLGSRLRGNDGL